MSPEDDMPLDQVATIFEALSSVWCL